jgi:ubiquinone/menaquinone biosynthesis C-methylase UbiE
MIESHRAHIRSASRKSTAKLKHMSSITAYAGTVPANYEACLGPLLFEPYALDIIERLQSDYVHDVLELACGTGRVTRHLAALVPEGGSLVATDLNPDMIELAKTIVQNEFIEWMVADAQALRFGNERFDHVICQFGVMFFEDKGRAFREAYRVLRNGGKYVFNVWDSLDVNPRSALIQQVFIDLLGEGSPDFMQKGPYSYFDREAICNELLRAGFEHVNLEVVTKQTRFLDPMDLVTGFVDGSPLSSFLSKQPPGLRQDVKDRLLEAIEGQAHLYGNSVPLQALVIEAIR